MRDPLSSSLSQESAANQVQGEVHAGTYFTTDPHSSLPEVISHRTYFKIISLFLFTLLWILIILSVIQFMIGAQN